MSKHIHQAPRRPKTNPKTRRHFTQHKKLYPNKGNTKEIPIKDDIALEQKVA